MGPLAGVKHCTPWLSLVASISLSRSGSEPLYPHLPQMRSTVALPRLAKRGMTAAPPNPEHKDLQVVTSQQALEKQLSSGPRVTRRSD